MTTWYAVTRRSLRARLRGEQGSATVFVVGFAVVLLAGAGLAIDGGRAINAREHAVDVAEQAARAGANALDVAQLRDAGRVEIDPVLARQAASSYLNQAGYSQGATVDPSPAGVTVRITSSVPTALLGLVGIQTIDISGEATARPSTGITTGDAP